MSCLRNEVRLAGQEINAAERPGLGEGVLGAARLCGEGSGGSFRQNGLCFLPSGPGPLEREALKEPSRLALSWTKRAALRNLAAHLEFAHFHADAQAQSFLWP